MAFQLNQSTPDVCAREETVLIERLVSRQGVSFERALQLVDEHKRGAFAEIDPVMLEGLQTL